MEEGVQQAEAQEFSVPVLDSVVNASSDTLEKTDEENEDSVVKRKHRSGIWDHFTITEENGASYANCKYCKKGNGKYKISGKSNSGTGNLNRHMKEKNIGRLTNSNSTLSNRIGDLFNQQINSQQLKDSFKQELFYNKLLRWIVVSDQPHTEVENPAFVELVKYLNQNANVMGANKLKSELISTFDLKRKEVINIFKNVPGKISFTHDGWTSPNQIPFLGIKAHWITENWESVEMLMDFPNLKGKHSGENISITFQDSLNRFDISYNKVFAVTTDNASNNDTFFQHLEKSSTINGVVHFIETESRMRCAAHVLNLVVQSLLSNLKLQPLQSEDEDSDDLESEDNMGLDSETHLNEIQASSNESVHSNVVLKLRKLVRSIRKSVQKREQLAKFCTFHHVKCNQLIIDVKTRWNSTYSMVQRALELKVPISTFCASNPDLTNLTDHEWNALLPLCRLLEKFDRATQHLSMVRHPTISSVIPTYDWLKLELQKYNSDSNHEGPLSAAGKIAYQKLTEYEPSIEDSIVLYLAVILRPSLKLNYFKKYPTLYDKRKVNKIKSLAIETFKDVYDQKYSEVKSTVDEACDLDDEFLAHLSKRSRKEPSTSEMQLYLAAPLASTKTNTLEWWKTHELEFPNVARMARDVLAAQSTSVPMEREFSGGVDLIVPTRHRLAAKTITASMCLKSWWKNEK